MHAGNFHSLVLTSSGRLLGFGDNSYGQLGGARQGFMHEMMQQAQAGERELDEHAFEAEVCRPRHPKPPNPKPQLPTPKPHPPNPKPVTPNPKPQALTPTPSRDPNP